MESENARPAFAMPLHEDHSAFSFDHELGGLTAMPAMDEEEDHLPPTQTPRRPAQPDNMHATPWLDTPLHVTDHGVPSNVRDSHGQQEQELPQLPAQPIPAVNDFPPVNESTTLLERKPSDAMVLSDDGNDRDNDAMSAILQDSQMQLSLGPEAPSTPSHMEATTAAPSPEHITEEAFAMLKFNDSHCYVRSTNLVIGRDMNFLAKYQQQKKDEKKKRARAFQARRALDIYAREPSQPSLMGDDDPSGESLEGRPEPTGPLSVFSVFSEQGGPVAYNNPYSDDENEDHSRTRRRDRKNKSSSNTSVAPKSLMAFAEGENLQAENRYAADGTLTDPREWAQLPVHPPIPADIKKISREHLLFHYDSNRGRWLLDVIGNGAIFNGVSYVKDTTDLELNHNDEIFIATLGMRFMLPESVVNEPEPESDDEEDEEALATSMSPARRLSNLFSADESSDDDDEPLAQIRAAAKPPVPKLKLKFKKSAPKEEPGSDPEVVGGKGKGGKGKGKASKSKDKSEKTDKPDKAEKKAEKKPEKKPAKPDPKPTPTEETAPPPLPEVAKTTDTVRKPSDAAAGESAPAVPAGTTTEQSPPAVPHVIDPTSVLANLAPDQLPEKRKGPGRPPKNGLLSKRDESGVKRKTKEFERRGVPVPALETLIAMVRQEQKAKDAANKAQARGEPIPDMPMPSIESSDMMQDGERGRQQTPRESHTMESGSPGGDRKLSPRLPRPIPREASPIKPMSEFTEEELKKPNMTYIYIIDEVLQNVEGGKADLQAIYDKIMKRWPFYKYKVGSLGWQSSVRHNLLSCDRFRDAGKSGKGKLWAINHDHPLDNKKRKPTPPPRPMQMPMANGQMPLQNMGPNQFGQPHYNGQYQPANGQQPYPGKPGSGPYYSPYGQGGNYPPNGPPGMRQGSNGAYPANASQTPQPQSQPPPPPNPFQPVVDAIIKYRAEWLGSVPPSDPEYKNYEDTFARGTNYFSSLYHGSGDATVSDAEISSVEPFMTLKGIFERHKHLFETKPAEATSAAGQGSGANANGQSAGHGQPAAGTSSGGGPSSAATGPSGGPPTDVTASGSGGPPMTGTTPASGVPPSAEMAPAPYAATAAAPSQPAPMAPPIPAGRDQDTNMPDAHISAAASTGFTSGNLQAAPATSASAPSNGIPAGVPMPPASAANMAPVDASAAIPTTAAASVAPVETTAANVAPVETSVAAPASIQQHAGDTEKLQTASVGSTQASAQSQPLQPVAQRAAVMTAPNQPGTDVPVPSPTAGSMTPAAQQPAVPQVEAGASLPAPPPTISPSAPTPPAAEEASVPSAGTKRSADDNDHDEENGDAKRAKLS